MRRFNGVALCGAASGHSLEHAQLQGAWLDRAQLQGATLERAELQGATLDYAQLQGASLEYAQLQGTSLFGAQIQGASLYRAELQGADLRFAHLQGVSLNGAQLQGAALEQAQLQGAWLVGAAVNTADFSYAFLWRTDWGEIDPAKLGAVRLDAASARWKPVWQEGFIPTQLWRRFIVPWDAKAYAALRDSMNSIPEGKVRDDALRRIKILDCGNPDKTLASCDSAAKPPWNVLDWQKKLAAAGVDDAAYVKALATELRGLVCASDADSAIPLLDRRLARTGREAPALVDFIMSKDCPVSASLTVDDRAKLLKIKQDAEQKSAPPSAPKKEK
ncbi:MAG: pentapeptide repeat-containing protein [Pseudomonadota bacterium]|nr:pentapeptide repeat-containing protein [Pseudomonadota bacterium]